ncbi:SpoIIE family protein phosphatase [Embleya sp. NBC_00896]|uniref:SpoIIE family protein phosphatase n=1 Tax=Embleya sp. NBC_00896 TaxID=2975961 RepID=UPI00386BC85F|nr:SpoIIE family protein phosphatase [Embleya sp. NBC_00896]
MTGQRPSSDERGRNTQEPAAHRRTNGFKPPHAPDEPEAALWSPAEVLDESDTGVVVFTPGGTVRYLNPAARRLLPDCVAGGGYPTLPATGATWNGEVDDRRVRGRRAVLGGGHYAWYVQDTTAERRREDALLAERRRKVFLAEAGRVLAATTNPRRLTDLVTTLPARELADWVALSVPSMEDGRLRTTYAPATGSPIARVTTGLGAAWTAPAGVGRVLRTGRQELHPLMDHALLSRLVPIEAVADLMAVDARCALVVPVPTDDDAPSVLTFVRAATSDPFAEEEIALAVDYAERVGVALRTSRLYVEQDRRTLLLAEALVPGPLPEVPGARIAARYRPVSLTNGLGGDFYAVHPTADAGAWAFSVGDVCGRGTPVGMFSSRSLLILRTAASAGCGPARRMGILDGELTRGDPSLVLTAITGDCSVRADGSALIRLTCAGHPPPLWMDPAGRVRAMEFTDPLVAGIPGTVFTERELLLPPGSTLLLYSDGVTEARDADGTAYGVETLRHDLASCAGMPVDALVERLEHRLMLHLADAPVVDDVVLMAIHLPYRDGDKALPLLVELDYPAPDYPAPDDDPDGV